jgi:Zn-dependent peptidase ImmA (M78 family)
VRQGLVEVFVALAQRVLQVDSPWSLMVFDAQPTFDNAHDKCKDRREELYCGRRRMSVKVTVRPKLLRWARQRVSMSPDELASGMKVPLEMLVEWERSGSITLARLRKLAQKTHTPFGYFFLQEPRDDSLPIADFRTKDKERAEPPSPDLLDTLYLCQRRQGWYHDYLISEGPEPLTFVGSTTVSAKPEAVARSIKKTIELSTTTRASLPTWREALRDLVQRIENAGILVMSSSIVGNNTHRKLDVSEFRGFALTDEYAPLIFVNAADAKAAQMFTLAHELTHIWLGQSGVSDIQIGSDNRVERFCNSVTAELLVPMAEFKQLWQRTADVSAEIQALAKHFKVSALVLLIRALEAGSVSYHQFDELYSNELARQKGTPTGTGGDFYKTQASRLGRQFSEAVIVSALSGRLTYTEAFRLLGVRSEKVLDSMAQRLGVFG